MALVPIAQPLALCDYVIVEERTKKISLIGTFWSIAVDDGFPTRPLPFSLVAMLTGGLGPHSITLKVLREVGLELEEIYSNTRNVEFRDRFQPVYYTMRFQRLKFPEPGHYHFELSVGEAELARCTLRIYDRKGGGQ
jgi:hypothetical protein